MAVGARWLGVCLGFYCLFRGRSEGISALGHPTSCHLLGLLVTMTAIFGYGTFVWEMHVEGGCLFGVDGAQKWTAEGSDLATGQRGWLRGTGTRGEKASGPIRLGDLSFWAASTSLLATSGSSGQHLDDTAHGRPLDEKGPENIGSLR